MLAFFECAIGWRELVKRTYRDMMEDAGLGLAAQLAYYFFLSLFPAILCVVAIASFLPLQTFTDDMVRLLGPFAPYLTAELWQELGQASAVEKSSWPDFDAELAREDDVEVVLQVNGKLRSKLNVPRGTSREELERMAKEDPKVIAHLDGKAIRKAIVVPDKLVNVVVG